MKTNIHLQSWLRRAVLLLIVLTGSLPMMAQQEVIEGGEAFYIYQNDGHFDGFFYDQVKQIRFSRLDTLGNEHDQYISQEIVTEDSIYRIMLTAIDSVSLVQPEIKYAKEVRFMSDEGMMVYYQSISKPDDNSFLLRFNGSMPADLQPKVGDVLSCPKLKDYDEAFVGKVKKVRNDGGEILVECGYVDDLSEVFEQFVTVEQIRQVKTSEGYQARRRMAGIQPVRRAEGNWEDITIFNVSTHLEGNIDLLEGSEGIKVVLGTDLGFGAVASAVYKITGWRDFYMKAEVKPQVGLNFSVSIDGGIEGSLDMSSMPGVGALVSKFSKIPFPATCPILYINVMPEPFLRGEAHVALTLNTGTTIKAMGIGCELMSEYPYINPSVNLLPNPIIPASSFMPSELEKEFKLTAELNGMAQLGLKFPIELGTMDWLKWIADAKTKSTLYAGPKLEGKIPFNLSGDMLERSLFENMKDAELNFSLLSLDTEFSSEAKIFGWDGEVKKSFNFTVGQYPMKAFPEIDIENMKFDLYGDKKNNIKVSYGTQGNVFLPQWLGVGIYKPENKDDKEFKTLYKNGYRNEKYFLNTFNNVELSFEDLEPGEYTVCPIIKLLVPGISDKAIPAYKGRYQFTVSPLELLLVPDEIQAEEDGGTFTVEILSSFENPVTFDIPETLKQWVKAELVTGSMNSKQLKLNIEANETDAFRTGVIYVRQEVSAQEVFERPLTIKQYGGLQLSKSNLEFQSQGGEETIDILTSYKPITINLNDGLEWLNYSLDDHKLTITAKPNEEGTRKATVFVTAWSDKKGQYVEAKLYVTQKGLVDATIDPTELNFEIQGGTQRVYVVVGDGTELTDVSVRDKSNKWITIEKMSSLFNVIVAPNEDEDRSAYVDATFTTKKDGKTYTTTLTVAIYQKGAVTIDPNAPQIEFTKSDFKISPLSYKTRIGSYVKFKVSDISAKQRFTTLVEGGPCWYTLEPKIYSYPDQDGLYTVTWNITVEPNEWDIDREATIRFTYQDETKENMAIGTLTILQKSSKTLITLKEESVNLHSLGGYEFLNFDLELPGSVEGKPLNDWLRVFNNTDTRLEVHAETNVSGQVRTGGVEVSVFDGSNKLIGVDTVYVTQSVIDPNYIQYIEAIDVCFEGMSNIEDHKYLEDYEFDPVKMHDVLVGYHPVNSPFNWVLALSFREGITGDGQPKFETKLNGSTLHVEAIEESDKEHTIWIRPWPHNGDFESIYGDTYTSQWPHTGEYNVIACKVKAKVSFDLENLTSSVNDLSKVKVTNLRVTVDCLDKSGDQYYPHSIEASASGLSFISENSIPTWELGFSPEWTIKSGTLSDSHTELTLEAPVPGAKTVEKKFSDSYSGLTTTVSIKRYNPDVFGQARPLLNNRAPKVITSSTLETNYNSK